MFFAISKRANCLHVVTKGNFLAYVFEVLEAWTVVLQTVLIYFVILQNKTLKNSHFLVVSEFPFE